MANEKKMVPREKAFFDVNWNTLAYIRDEVESLIDIYGEDAWIEKTSYGEEYLAVMVAEEETDTEFNKRVEAESITARYRESNKKKIYEELKKKYEGK